MNKKWTKKGSVALAVLSATLLLSGCSTPEIQSTSKDKIEATSTLETYPLNYLDQEMSINSGASATSIVISYTDKKKQEKIIYLKLSREGELSESDINYYEHILTKPEQAAYLTLQKDGDGKTKIDVYRQPYSRWSQPPLEGEVVDKETKK